MLTPFLAQASIGLLQPKPIKIMKLLRLLPFCLSVLALPLVLTGCNRAGDDTGSTATDTNAAPATADTNAASSSTTTTTTADTNAAPATTDTNTTTATNTTTGTTNSSGM